MDNPVTRVDEAIRDGIFQPLVDRFEFHPKKAIRLLILIHAALMAGMYTAYLSLDAQDIPVMSHFEATIGIPAYGVLEVGFLWAYVRMREYFAHSAMMIALRVLMASSAILLTIIVPRVLFGTAADEYLDASGRTPFALRQATGTYILARWTFTAVMYLTLCRKPPPRRRLALA
jgi:hypothetical protein